MFKGPNTKTKTYDLVVRGYISYFSEYSTVPVTNKAVALLHVDY